MNIERFEHVIFDMDGVLLDSNRMKIAAAQEVISKVEPTAIDAFVTHFKHNFGLTRRDHFLWGYEHLLRPHGHDESIVERMMSDYAQYVARCYRTCPVTSGTRELLAALRPPCYVLTGSDQMEARTLLAEMGLAPHFVEILGSPTSKTENLSRLIERHAIRPESALLIGDSHHDFAAARAFGLSFALVTRYMPCDAAPLVVEVRAAQGSVVETLDELIYSKVHRC